MPNKKAKPNKPLIADLVNPHDAIISDWGETDVVSGTAAPPPETGWAEAVASTDDVKGSDEDVWQTEPSANVTLDIHQHSGQFDPQIAKILIYGETGMQKTRLASTFPNVIFANVDHGMSSVTEQVDEVYIDDDNTGFEKLKGLYRFLKEGQHDYKAVVIDTLNEMQRVIMRFTIEEYTHIRRSYGNLPGQSDYGKMLYEFLELTRDFISLPMQVVLIAQVNSKVFDTDILMPQLVGKNSAREILRKMDVVGHLYRQEGEGEHKLPIVSFDSVEFVTKDRSNKLPVALSNPSYDRIAAYWK